MILDTLLHMGGPRFRAANGRAACPHAAAFKSILALCLCLALAQCPLLADGVTRSVEPVAGGCKVTLAWEFSGKVESDLVIEERLAQGWTVNDSTVPFDSLDASWFSDRLARFAVKPALLSKAGSITFTVVPGEDAASGAVFGSWKMYLGGALRKGSITGQNAVAVLAGNSVTSGNADTSGSTGTSGNSGISETAIAISSFKLFGGAVIELSYAYAPKAGSLVVEGSEGLGGEWTELKRIAVPAGAGKVQLAPGEVGGRRFFRIKLLAVEE